MLAVTVCLYRFSSLQTHRRWLNSHECVRPSPLSHFLLEKAHRPLRTGTPWRDVHLSLDSGPFMLPHIPPNLCTVLAFANSATISAALCIICRKFRV